MHKTLCSTLNAQVSVPALLYTVQNNALFIAVENLEAAVFQCTYQLKTLTTAVLIAVMLAATSSRTSGWRWPS